MFSENWMWIWGNMFDVKISTDSPLIAPYLTDFLLFPRTAHCARAARRACFRLDVQYTVTGCPS